MRQVCIEVTATRIGDQELFAPMVADMLEAYASCIHKGEGDDYGFTLVAPERSGLQLKVVDPRDQKAQMESAMKEAQRAIARAQRAEYACECTAVFASGVFGLMCLAVSAFEDGDEPLSWRYLLEAGIAAALPAD